VDDGTRLKVFVCGGRDFRDAELLSRILGAVHSTPGIESIIHCRDRAGRFAADWAIANSVRVLTVNGDRLTPAGLSRMAEKIVRAGQPELAIGFSGGVSTQVLLDYLACLGVRVRGIAATYAEP
jgi:hypothetical protein